jgi:hypothetical protein
MTDREQLATIANQLNLVPNVRVIAVKDDDVIIRTPNGQQFTITVASQPNDFDDCA